jgi:ATP synthase protein I
MSEDGNGNGTGGDLGSRVRAAQARRRRHAGGDGQDGDDRRETGRGIAFAFRLGTELVAGLIVGVGGGLLLDRWLDSGPWLMVVGFILGSAAGILNVYRTVEGAERARRGRGGN